MVFVKEQKAYQNDKSTEIPEAEPILKNIIDGHNSLLEPEFDPAAKFENELKEDDTLEDLINSEGEARYPKTLYTLDDDLIPAEFRATAENPNNIKIKRKLLVIKVEKSTDGKLAYHQYTEKGGKLVPADTEGNPLDEGSPAAEWKPDEAHTFGMKRNEGGDHWIEINDFVFVGNNDAIEAAKAVSGVKNVTNNADKDNTLTHELQHFRNSLNMHKLFKDGKNPHVSIKDYYRLCYLDEVSATLATVLKDKDKKPDEYSKTTRNILSGKEFPNLESPNGKKELLQAVMTYWNKDIAKLYAADSVSNNQFRTQLEDYVKSNPWGSNITDNSDDYKKAVQEIFKNINGSVNFSDVVLNEDMPDPVKEHEKILKEGMDVSDTATFLDKMEDEADKLCEERAKYGFDEEFENKYHENPDGKYNTTPFRFESQRGDPFDEEERGFYNDFFKRLCEENNKKEDKTYDLEFEEINNHSKYEINLIRKEAGGIINTTNIKINSDKSVVMTATTADGKTAIPDQDRFNNLAELAAQHGDNKIKFGNIRDPEFKARLYLACITHKPPVEMENAPDLNNEEFRKSISPETLMSIKNVERINKLKEKLKDADRIAALEKVEKCYEEMSDGMNYAEWYKSNKKEALEELLKKEKDGKKLFEKVTDEKDEITHVKAAEGANAEDVKAALKEFGDKRKNDYIKYLSEGKTGYEHGKKDSDGKPVTFYQQIKNAKGSR